MNITHHKNGEIKTLVEEAPYHPGYEDAGFKPNQAKELTDEEIAQEWGKFYPDVFHTHLIEFARAILRKASEK